MFCNRFFTLHKWSKWEITKTGEIYRRELEKGICYVQKRTSTNRTNKGVVIDITPDPVPDSVKAILKQVGEGTLDAYQVLNHPMPGDENQVLASRILQRLYDAKCEGTRLHPDDDFEKILDAVSDDLQKELS